MLSQLLSTQVVPSQVENVRSDLTILVSVLGNEAVWGGCSRDPAAVLLGRG